jgi:16S rRNA (uracil1498-N3)-methyltransferase
MPRIFISHTSVQEGQISITGEKARYLISVLKCEKGSELSIFDGRGNCLRTNIVRADKKEVLVKVLETFHCNTESPVNIMLVQGFLKGQKMDIVVQKTTELGVKAVIPVVTERSQPGETRKRARWQKIAEEASRQSGRSVVPLIHEPVHFNDYLSSLVTCHLPLSLRGFIFWEEGGISLKDATKTMSLSTVQRISDLPVHILIGPEGGFTKNETALAESKGFIITSLGKRILRAETAAISAMTLVQFLLGDLS